MAKDTKFLEFLEAKGDTLDNLKAIRESLMNSVEEGMVDLGDEYYNQLSLLLDEATISRTWDELTEVISKAKNLEIDVAVWLAQRGRTSISLSWPRPIKGK